MLRRVFVLSFVCVTFFSSVSFSQEDGNQSKLSAKERKELKEEEKKQKANEEFAKKEEEREKKRQEEEQKQAERLAAFIQSIPPEWFEEQLVNGFPVKPAHQLPPLTKRDFSSQVQRLHNGGCKPEPGSSFVFRLLRYRITLGTKSFYCGDIWKDDRGQVLDFFAIGSQQNSSGFFSERRIPNVIFVPFGDFDEWRYSDKVVEYLKSLPEVLVSQAPTGGVEYHGQVPGPGVFICRP